MKTPIRYHQLALGAAILVAGLAASGAALAAAARTNSPVTLLDGPGYGRPVGNIGAAQNVDVGQCQADYCYLTFGPLAGWAPQDSLDIRVGPAGPGASVGIEVVPPPPPEPLPEPLPPQIGGQDELGPPPLSPRPRGPRGPRGPRFATSGDVCFFEGLNYRGASFCMDAGDAQPFLGDWSNTIRSIDNPDGFDVRVCIDPGFRRCRVYTSSARSLGRFDMAISSASVE